MEINDKMQIAFSQVDTILNFYNQDLLDISIPQEVREYIKENKSKEYMFNIKANEFKSEMLTEESVCILLWIFENYFATRKQKEIISKWEYPNINFLKRESERQEDIKQENIKQELVPVKEESLISKVISKIKLIFRNGKNTDG